MVRDERSTDRLRDDQLERLLKQLADVPRVIPPLADFVELLAQSRNPRR